MLSHDLAMMKRSIIFSKMTPRFASTDVTDFGPKTRRPLSLTLPHLSPHSLVGHVRQSDQNDQTRPRGGAVAVHVTGHTLRGTSEKKTPIVMKMNMEREES